MVIVSDVHKSFGAVRAVRGVSFELRPGQIAGMLGPNGAGKTTTIRMIAGYLLPDRGSVGVAGYDTVDRPVFARRRLGYLPEANPLYPEMKVGEYLGFRARLFGMPRKLRQQAVAWAAERCWVKDVFSRRIGTLSKGYRQRVGLAAALLHNPAVLILDEPTNGLDPTQIGETRKLIRELAHERTMLVSSHILPEVERLCDRVIVVIGGRVRADGTPSELTRGGGARYVVECREPQAADGPRAQKMWLDVPGVAEAVGERPERAGAVAGWTQWTIRARPEVADLREALWGAAREAGLSVRELRAEEGTLEAVFARLVEETSAETDPPRSGGPPRAKEAA